MSMTYAFSDFLELHIVGNLGTLRVFPNTTMKLHQAHACEVEAG